MKGLTIFSDQYKCSTVFCWKKGCLEILGISFPEGNGISIDNVIRDISELSGVKEDEIRKLLRKLVRKTGNYYTSLKDLRQFIASLDEGERKEELVAARAALVSNII